MATRSREDLLREAETIREAFHTCADVGERNRLKARYKEIDQALGALAVQTFAAGSTPNLDQDKPSTTPPECNTGVHSPKFRQSPPPFRFSQQESAVQRSGSPDEQSLWNRIDANAKGYTVVGIVLFVLVAVMTFNFFDPYQRPAPSTPRPARSVGAAARPTPRQDMLPEYEIHSREDVSFGGTVRYAYHVIVPNKMTETDLQNVAQDIVKRDVPKNKLEAAMIFFYLEGSDPNGHYTAGRATWAMDGNWAAIPSHAGDYSLHKYSIDVGNALGVVDAPVVQGLSLEQKRNIFRDIVKEQDKGGDQNVARNRVGQRYGLDAETTEKLVVEGVVQGWPMD